MYTIYYIIFFHYNTKIKFIFVLTILNLYRSLHRLRYNCTILYAGKAFKLLATPFKTGYIFYITYY
jgi:hypothetical protein